MPHQAVDSLPYWLAFFAWVGQQRYVLWKEQVARLSGAMGAVLGVGRHACRLGADPAIVNRIGEDGIDIAVEIRFLPGVRISLGKGLVDAVQNGHHMVNVRCKLRWCGDDPCACVWVSGSFVRGRLYRRRTRLNSSH